MRVGRGVYVTPYQGRLGARHASTESVVQAIEAGGSAQWGGCAQCASPIAKLDG
jgi:hypothetical protein